MKIVLLGAPGSGKGTLAKMISNDFTIPQISTGDLFRKALKEDNELGKKIKSYMASGGLVPDEITIQMLKERIEEKDCQNGFILDGFPRTVNQAQALEKLTSIDHVFLIELPFETIIERLSSRRTCSDCGEIYNLRFYQGTNCQKCGAGLIQRDDDKPQTIKHRLEVYENMTSPLINFYSERLVRFSTEGNTPEENYTPVKTYLESFGGEA